MFKRYKSALLMLAVLLLPAVQSQASTLNMGIGDAAVIIGLIGTNDGGSATFNGSTYAYDQYDFNITPGGVPAEIGGGVFSFESKFVFWKGDFAGLQFLKDGNPVADFLATSFGPGVLTSLSLAVDGVSSYSMRVFGDFGTDYEGLLNVSVSAVPLPAAAWLFLSALGGFGWLGRRKKAQLAA